MFICSYASGLVLITVLLVGVVSERIREAVKNSSAPMMMLFPGLLMCSKYIVYYCFSSRLLRPPLT